MNNLKKLKIMTTFNCIFTKNSYNYDGEKIVNTNDTISYKNLSELYTILEHIISDEKYYSRTKYQLPYLLTTEVKLGKLAGQTGNYINLILDIDDGISRHSMENLFKDYEYIIYNSYSHGLKENDRFRMIIALDRPYTVEEIKSIKHRLITIFPYADINSFKRNTLMYAPTMYDGVRNPELKYNNGITLSFEQIINEEHKVKNNEVEKKAAKNIISNRTAIITNNTKYNKEKQQKTLDKVLSSYQGRGHHTTHDWLFKAMIQLKSAGISDNDIITTLEPYETIEHKGKVSRDINNYTVNVSPYYIEHNTETKVDILNSVKPLVKEQTILKVNTYLTELSDEIIRETNDNDKLLIQADTNIGKTYFFTHLKEKVLLVVPTRLLVEQLTEKLLKENIQVSDVLSGTQPDLGSNLIISTYDGLQKFNNAEGTKWLKDAIFVVDEAHNLSISSSSNFRQKAMRLIQNVKASKYIYLTASPIDTDTITNTFHTIIVEKKERRLKGLKMVFYKDRLNTVIKNILTYSKTSKQIVYINNKNELEKLQVILNKLNYKTQLISSDTIEEYQELILEGKIDKDTDIILTTSILGEGFRFYQNFEALHLLSHISPEMIYQMSERPEHEAVKDTFLYLDNSKSLYSADFDMFDVNKYRALLLAESKNIIDISKVIKDETIKHHLTKELYEYDTDDMYQHFSKQAENILIDQYCEKYGNLVYKTDNELKVNELGINYEVYTENTKFYWRNPVLLLQKLLSYNYYLKVVIIDEEIMNKENKKQITEAKKTLKDKKVEEFNELVNECIEQDNETLDESLWKEQKFNTYEIEATNKKINKIQYTLNNDRKEASEILKSIGNSQRKLNQFINRVVLSNTKLKLRSKFNKDKLYTNNEITSIIRKYMTDNTPLKSKLTSTKCTQIFKDIFEVKTQYNSTSKNRTFKILSTDSYKNSINVELDHEKIISKKRTKIFGF